MRRLAFWAAVLVLVGLILIGLGFSSNRTLSTHIMAAGTKIELTWDNGDVLTVKDVLDVDDPHVLAVRVWGGSFCWITVNDRLVDAKESPEPVVCTWSRG